MPDEREHAALRDIVNSLFPVAPRAPGTIYDGYIGNRDIASYPFESITAPTLVLAAEDDTLAPTRTQGRWLSASPARGSSASHGAATPLPTLTPVLAGATLTSSETWMP